MSLCPLKHQNVWCGIYIAPGPSQIVQSLKYTPPVKRDNLQTQMTTYSTTHALGPRTSGSTITEQMSIGGDKAHSPHIYDHTQDTIYDDQYLTHTNNHEYTVEPPRRPSAVSTSSTISAEQVDFYALEARDIHGNVFGFEQLKGKYVLIVNVATQCAGAHQLRDLEAIYQRFKLQGLVVLGFPSNQFFQERSKDPEKIVSVCEKKFNVSFPLMEKVRVNGKNQHDVWRYLKDQKLGFLKSKRVKWNYEKFLVDREGKIVQRYSTFQKPAVIEKEIERVLQEENKHKRTASVDKKSIRLAENQKVIYI